MQGNNGGGVLNAFVMRQMRLTQDDAARQRLVTAIRNRDCLEHIQELVQANPRILCMSDIYGKTPLHVAVRKEAPLDVIQLLVGQFPRAAAMGNKIRFTPLHYACQCPSSFETVEIMVDAYPGALAKLDSGGNTPLHVACRSSDSPTELIEMLASRNLEAVSTANKNGETPLHFACWYGLSEESIEVLMNLCPEALQMQTNHGWTVLHSACRRLGDNRISYSLIETMIKYWPVATLVLEASSRQLPGNVASERFDTLSSPLHEHGCDCLLEVQRIDALVQGATIQAACALIEAALDTHSAMPAAVKRHILQALFPHVKGDQLNGSSTSALVLQARKDLKDNAKLHNLVESDRVQSLLKQTRYQDFISGLFRMNQAGRSQIQLGDKQGSLRVLESVSNLPTCSFLHLRQSPCLFLRRKADF